MKFMCKKLLFIAQCVGYRSDSNCTLAFYLNNLVLVYFYFLFVFENLRSWKIIGIKIYSTKSTILYQMISSAWIVLVLVPVGVHEKFWVQCTKMWRIPAISIRLISLDIVKLTVRVSAAVPFPARLDKKWCLIFRQCWLKSTSFCHLSKAQ